MHLLKNLSIALSCLFLLSCTDEATKATAHKSVVIPAQQVKPVYIKSSSAEATASKAYNYAYSNGITKSKYYIYVDFTKPITEKRLFVVYNGKVVYSTWVSHGSGSGTGSYVTKVSNIPNSLATSVGVSQVLSYYTGHNGKSAKLSGLDVGFNDNIYKRSIVIHSASYIGNGKTGHSWGCLAVSRDSISEVLKYAQPGTIIINYYPDANWLGQSKFLK